MRWRRPVGVAAALCALAGTLMGCGGSDAPGSAGRSDDSSSETASPAAVESGPAVIVASATLTDSVVPEGQDRIAWTTTWRACFAPDPADPVPVTGWQAQALSLEGTSPQLQELPDGCLELDVAGGVNAAEAGMPGRDIQLADAAALAYQVRGVHEDGTVTPWTDPVRAGSALSGG